MKPEEWLISALSVGGAKDAFKLLAIDTIAPTVLVRVLHKDTGAVWQFACYVEREGVK